MKTFLNKILATFMAAFACLLVVSCESKDSDTIQAEVVFPSDVNLTKIDQWESSIELEQLGTNIPFEIKSNSEWEIYFSFDDNCFCLAYPNKGIGNATVELCVFNNPTDERCTGKMYIVFPKDLGKSHIVQLSQKGNIDNDDNYELPVPGLDCPVCEGFIPIKLQQLMSGDEILCPDCGYSILPRGGQSAAAIEALRKVEEAIEYLRMTSNFSINHK